MKSFEEVPHEKDYSDNEGYDHKYADQISYSFYVLMISTFGILATVLASDSRFYFADPDFFVDHSSFGWSLAELGAGFDIVHLTLALAVLALSLHLRTLGAKIIITGTIGI